MTFMHYGAKPKIFTRAKKLRRTETEAEKILWEKLRKNQLGFKFRRQHPLHHFITDFYCHELKLVIEVDGEIHLLEENIRYDELRTAVINEFGIFLIRFTNHQILCNLPLVIEDIKSVINRILEHHK